MEQEFHFLGPRKVLRVHWKVSKLGPPAFVWESPDLKAPPKMLSRVHPGLNQRPLGQTPHFNGIRTQLAGGSCPDTSRWRWYRDPSGVRQHFSSATFQGNSWMWNHLKDVFISSYFSVSSFSCGFSQSSHLSGSSKGTRTSWIRPEQEQEQQRFLPVGHFLPSGEPALQNDSPKNLLRHKVNTFPLEKNP